MGSGASVRAREPEPELEPVPPAVVPPAPKLPPVPKGPVLRKHRGGAKQRGLDALGIKE